MKQRILSLALALALCLGLAAPVLAAGGDLFPAVTSMPAFTDVSSDGKAGGVWYDYESVKVCVEAGLMKGSGAAFNPGGQITIAELAMICARINERLTGMAVPEKEDGEIWYAPAIRVMEELGIDTGADPMARATRNDFARLLSAVCGGDTLAPINAITALPDTDSWDVLRLYNAGILTGTDKYGTFSPNGSLSRAETAAMLARLVRPSLRKSFVPAVRPSVGDLNSLTQLLLGMNADDTLATVDGVSISVQSFLYHLRSAVKQQAELSGGPGSINWDMDMSSHHMTGSLSDHLKSFALENATLFALIDAECARAGVTLTAEDRAYLDGYHAYAVETLGSEEAYRRYLRQNCVDEAGLRYLQSVTRLYANLEQHLFPTPDAKELAAYEEETGLLKAKHILVSDRSLAEDLLAQLKAGGNSEATFDALAEEYSEDGREADGSLAVPGGYVFLPGEMVREFEDAAKALKPGEMSGIVQSDYGFHIILRLPLRAEDVLSLSGETVRDTWAGERMDALFDYKQDHALVEFEEKAGEAYEALDVETFYDLLGE